MEFFRLDSVQDISFVEAFALYESSFPQHERRLIGKQTALMTNPRYHFDVIKEDRDFIGILLYWEGSEYVYIEHFAIRTSLRGKAIGTRVLETFCREHSRVILEIDPPVNETAISRERFYQRLGFKTNGYAHRHPAYQKQFPPHELVVMSYPHPLTEGEYQLFRRELEEIVMKDSEIN